jgi:hypothetical protein
MDRYRKKPAYATKLTGTQPQESIQNASPDFSAHLSEL